MRDFVPPTIFRTNFRFPVRGSKNRNSTVYFIFQDILTFTKSCDLFSLIGCSVVTWTWQKSWYKKENNINKRLLSPANFPVKFSTVISRFEVTWLKLSMEKYRNNDTKQLVKFQEDFTVVSPQNKNIPNYQPSQALTLLSGSSCFPDFRNKNFTCINWK